MRINARIQKISVALLLTFGFAWSAAADEYADMSIDQLYQNAKTEGSLVYYTSQVGVVEQKIAAKFGERYPGVNVEVVYAGGGVLYNRIVSEAQAGQNLVDVHLQSDLSLMERLRGDGLLAQWYPPEAKGFTEAERDQGYWTVVAKVANVIIYNKLKVDAADAPRSWQDLLDPKWKGRIAAVHIGGGGLPWAKYYWLRKQYPDYWKHLAANEPVMFDGGGAVVNAVVTGTADVGMLAGSVSYGAVSRGAPITEVAPTDSAPGVQYSMAVMQKASHPNAARLFVNWYLSQEGQSTLVNLRGIGSPRDDVPGAPNALDPASLKIVVPTLDEMGAVRDKWFEEWANIFKYRP